MREANPHRVEEEQRYAPRQGLLERAQPGERHSELPRNFPPRNRDRISPVISFEMTLLYPAFSLFVIMT